MKTDTKLTLHHTRKTFIIPLTKIKSKTLQKPSTTKKKKKKKNGRELRAPHPHPFPSQETIHHLRTEMRRILVYSLV